ncbi:prepilin peptidase [candidate division WOR-3 bacterium]|nr:prepilin peptidase [candidate division WOR-3 bacterium]
MLFVIQLTFTLLCLLYASYTDLKTREVSNTVWKLMLATAPFFAVYTFYHHDGFLLYVLSLVVTIILSYLMFVYNLIGGADTKALICISAVLTTVPFFALSVLVCAVVLALSVPIGLFVTNVRNLGWYETYASRRLVLIGYKPHVVPKFSRLLFDPKTGAFSKQGFDVVDKAEDVWVTPEIPFMVFITTGFVVCLVFLKSSL